MTTITHIHARQIFDSRANPTIEVEVKTPQGILRSAVPSGASTGIHEAMELRDKKKSYHGKGVLQAVKHVNTIIAKELVGQSVKNQKKIDQLLLSIDGTQNKSKLGANAILGVSMVVTQAGAAAHKIPLHEYIAQLANTKPCLPVPCMNIINGGQHAQNDLDIQEFMIVPIGATSFTQAMQMGTEIYHTLHTFISNKYGQSGVGDEGGFAPPMKSATEALKSITQAIKACGYEGKVMIALDAAASEFYSQKKYNFEQKKLHATELLHAYKKMVGAYPIISIEDPFDQDDVTAFTQSMNALHTKVQIVGDDLTVTNPDRITMVHNNKAANALLLKINQIGTISEAIRAFQLAQSYGWKVMVSHRSGETEDTFIADLVVGLGCGQIKSGAPCRSERVAKYNQILRLEEQYKLQYAGKKAFK